MVVPTTPNWRHTIFGDFTTVCCIAALAAKLSRIKQRSVRSSGDNGQGPNLNKRVSSTVSHLLYPVQVMRCEMYLRA